MFAALIKKDMRLLHRYLFAAVAATIGCYIFPTVGITWLTTYQDESMQTIPIRSFLILRTGYNLGFGVTALCSVLIAGSIFTLERADRSAEFLACLPPSRIQHLVSKYSLLFGMAAFMILVHIPAALLSDTLLPYVRSTSYPFTDGTQLSVVFQFVAVILSMTGGALAVSAWQNSNGVPILCGLLTPLGIFALLVLFNYLLDVPNLSRFEFLNRFNMFSSLVGLSLIFCGGYWYVERTEP